MNINTLNHMLKHEDTARLLLRLGVGGMMILHGVAKLGSTPSELFIKGQLAASNLPGFLYYGVFVGELLAPALVIAGIYCRLGGLIIVINMIFALFLAHSSELMALSAHGGWAIELQVFYLLGGLCIAFLGSGKYAIKPD